KISSIDEIPLAVNSSNPAVMQFTFRAASESDYAWLWQLKRLTMRTYVEAMWGGWDDAAQEDFFRRNFLPATIRVIVVDGQDVGLLHVERETEALFLANLQILPEFQNRGLGSAVVRRVIEEAHAMGLGVVRLQVLKSNQPARRLYERLGFELTQEGSMHDQMRLSRVTNERCEGRAGYP
ncbi:MAG: N-acetyltransferase, partial [Opitutaceae bacterium]